MGYRSDVGLCLTDAGKKILDAKLAELEPETDRTRHIHDLLNTPKREDQESGAVAWHWEYLKWYADYDDVAFVENLLQNWTITLISSSVWENPMTIRKSTADSGISRWACAWRGALPLTNRYSGGHCRDVCKTERTRNSLPSIS